MKTTVGKLLLKEHLPPSYHSYIDTRTLDKKGLSQLFNDLAESHASSYAPVTNALTRLGFEVATRQGSSVDLKDLLPPIDKKKMYGDFEKKLEKLKEKKLPEKEYRQKFFELYNPFINELTDKLVTEGTLKGNLLSTIVTAGSRGSPDQLRSTIGMPGVMQDGKGDPILDIPVINSFAEGLSPGEYLAHTFTARKGMVGTKLSVAEAGFFSKQLARAAMTLKIEDHDCGTHDGLDIPVSDTDYIGSYLAQPTNGYNRNTEYTRKVQMDLSSKGVKTVYLRTTQTCKLSRKHHFGAVCQLCAGKREKGLPAIGSHIGLVASTAAGEVVSQSSLNSKHGAGGGGDNSSASRATGFDLINQIANIPKTFKAEAPVAEFDGVVTSVHPSPAGGTFIQINSKEYYAPTGEKVAVKVGDKVERGQVLSGGIVNPSKIVSLLGVGEGRRYYANILNSSLGGGINKRNIDLIARSVIDHVEITDPDGLDGRLMGDVTSYASIEKNYKPRPDAQKVRTDKAKDLYLEEPVKHYTIGTQLTQTMVDDLARSGVEYVTAHTQPPGFAPVMVSLLNVPAHVEDWAHQLNSTYIERRLLNAVNKGMSSSIAGPSPVLGLAYSKGFGNQQQKKAADDESKGCLLLEMPEAYEFIDFIQKHIPAESLHVDGYENNPHITVMYGFPAGFSDFKRLEKVLSGFKGISIRLGKIDKFKNEDCDVLKIPVESEDLQRLYKQLREEFQEIDQTYPTYNPHVTLAYLRPDALDTLVGSAHFEGEVYVVKRLVYSSASEDTKLINLGSIQPVTGSEINEAVKLSALADDPVLAELIYKRLNH